MTCALIDGAKSSVKSSTKSSAKYFTLLFIAHLAAESADGRQRKNSGRISDERQNIARRDGRAHATHPTSHRNLFSCHVQL
jgi:hypothetical protein